MPILLLLAQLHLCSRNTTPEPWVMPTMRATGTLKVTISSAPVCFVRAV